MSDFSHISKLKVEKTTTARYTFSQIDWDQPPVLIVTHAGETNKEFYNAFLRSVKSKTRQISAGNINTEMLKEMRESYRKLFPRYIIKGWEHMVKSNGEPAKFDLVECQKFVTALPDQMFDELVIFCNNYTNFIPETQFTPDEVEKLAKN